MEISRPRNGSEQHLSTKQGLSEPNPTTFILRRVDAFAAQYRQNVCIPAFSSICPLLQLFIQETIKHHIVHNHSAGGYTTLRHVPNILRPFQSLPYLIFRYTTQGKGATRNNLQCSSTHTAKGTLDAKAPLNIDGGEGRQTQHSGPFSGLGGDTPPPYSSAL